MGLILSDAKHPKRGDVYWVKLDPTLGTEIKKTRPGVIVSNNGQNLSSRRVIVAPITSNVDKIFSFEAKITVDGRPAKALLDQIRSIDKIRLADRICSLNQKEIKAVETAMKIALDINPGS